MELICEMFKLKLLLMVLACLEIGVGSADPPSPYPPVLTDRSPVKDLKEPLGRPSTRIRTVSVLCYPTYMEVWVKADLFGLGMSVDPADLRLGADRQSGQSCRVTSASDEEYIIQSVLTDCGTEHWVTEEALIYSNLLVYSPAPSLDGLVRLEDAIIPVECHYRRKFDIGSDPVLPTWVPHQTTASALENLHFTFGLMTSDWRWKRGSGVYFLGDKINIQVGVHTLGMDLRVFIDGCVATANPDTDSIPRYDFIDDGCLVDGKVTGSNSYFLPRESPDKLRLQLDAFMFQQVKTDQIYITCTLKAYPLDYVSESMSKACSFISGSWRSAEGDDWTCSSCQNQFLLARSSMKLDSNASPRSQGKRTPLQSITQADSARWEPAKVITPKTLQEPATAWRSAWGSLRKADGSVALEQEASIGPLSIFTWGNKLGIMAPPKVKEGVPHFPSVRGRRPIPHHSLWKNRELNKTDVENKVITDVEKTDLWKEQSTVAEDLEADGTSAPESESTATPMPFTTSSEPSTAKDHFLIPAVSLPENDTTVHFPLPVSPAAETQELDANTDSPFYPSTSTMLNATLLETVTFSMDSEDNPESLQEGPV